MRWFIIYKSFWMKRYSNYHYIRRINWSIFSHSYMNFSNLLYIKIVLIFHNSYRFQSILTRETHNLQRTHDEIFTMARFNDQFGSNWAFLGHENVTRKIRSRSILHVTFYASEMHIGCIANAPFRVSWRGLFECRRMSQNLMGFCRKVMNFRLAYLDI